MRIGILTFPNSTSFGAALQMYALYRAVEKLGVEAEIINYHNAYMKAEQHTAAIGNSTILNRKLRLWGRHILHYKQYRGFRRFERELGLYPKKPFEKKEKLVGLSERYFGVICGSDQVWNPRITNQDMSYFLDFCGMETKRIAYAPSFGITEFSEEFQRRIKIELEKFDYLSVREVEGQQLLTNILNREIPLVLDPTFLLTQKEWSSLEKEHPAGKDDYILYYTVSKSQELFRFCLDMAEKENKKVVVVGGNALRQMCNKNKLIEYVWDLEPREWLYLLHRAQCVVTNSFHGTAFSIHYGKDFFVEFSSETNSRLEQIVRVTGLEKRIVCPGCAHWDEHIDYVQVNNTIAQIREQSVNYLKESICEGA